MSSMVNFRVEDDLLAAIDKARGSVSRSVWLREVVAKAASQTKNPHSSRALALQPMAQRDGRATSGDCVHPKTARKKLPFSEWCSACGCQLKVTI